MKYYDVIRCYIMNICLLKYNIKTTKMVFLMHSERYEGERT